MPPKRRKEKQTSSREVGSEVAKPASDMITATTTTTTDISFDPPNSTDTQQPSSKDEEERPLVLTSDKRRGVYECDYCHADISQVPRIRCAVCADFDLCLDCFSSSTRQHHATALAGLRATTEAVQDGMTNNDDGNAALTSAHDDSHGYVVADSTRYVLFPPSRAVVSSSRPPSCVDDGETQQDVGSDEDDTSAKEGSDARTINENIESEKGADRDVDMKDVSKEKEPTSQSPPEATIADKETKSIAVTDSEKQDYQEEDQSEKGSESVLLVHEDPKCTWTVEEDLRLLDAIATFGLGNWTDIAEAISGQASTNKSPRRCMERYLDDFLGRYGQILPQYAVVDCDDDEEDADEGELRRIDEDKDEDDLSRASKRRRLERNFMRSYSAISIMSQTTGRRKKKVVPTSSLPGYDAVWPSAYCPPIPTAELGREVGRVAHARAEQAFVKEVSQAASTEEAEKIRAEWTANRLNKADGPTVLPMRAEDIQSLKGSELAGYMPRRGDFDMEWDNDAEAVLADMEFTSSDLPQDRQLKIQVIEMYNSKLDERERRKQFLLSRGLLDYRKNQRADEELPRDERELVRRMRLFERLHTPEEHQQFIAEILKAKRLRKEIAKLQMYRRMGITSLSEAEKFELDKSRREFHKHAYLQKEAEAAAKLQAANASVAAAEGASTFAGVTESSSYWKQYRTTGRVRRSSSSRVAQDESAAATDSVVAGPGAATEGKTSAESSEAVESPSNRREGEVGKDSELGKTQDVAETVALGQQCDSSTQDDRSREKAKESDLVGCPGYELLSSKEVELCEKLGLLPAQYLEVKSALIQESMKQGLLDKSQSRRTIVKIDAEKHGDVIDFMVRAGWIASKRMETAGGTQQQESVMSTTANG